MADNNFVVQCNVCGQQYPNWTGSTPCCGSIAYLVEDGAVTKKATFFASMNGAPIESVVIDLTKKEE